MMRWLRLLWLLLAIACRSGAPHIEAEPPLLPFDKQAARRALFEAAEHAASCGQPEGPRGEGRTETVFVPNGTVRSVRFISGAFDGTETGRCVQGWFLKTTVPAYKGGTIMVTKKFEVR